jgi:tripartite-type tricarboxylate transporter receptor subunit TctC
MKKRTVILCLCGFLAFWTFVQSDAASAAPKFPTKAIKLVVPYKPGGGSDLSARIFAKHLAKYLPEKVIVANISGAAGRTAEIEVKRSRPDGYTLLWQHQTMHMAYATGRSDFNYTAFDAIASTVKAYSCVVVGKQSPYKTIKEILEAAKAKPKTIRWGAAINGTSHFAYMAIIDAADIDEGIFHLIGMSGDKNRIVAMLQGNMDVSAITLSSVRPYLESGDMKMIGVMAEERSDAYPNLPTLKEQGVNAINRFDYTTWAPKGVDKEIVKILSQAWIKAAKDPKCQKELKAGWMLPEFLAGADLDKFNKDQLDFFVRLAKKFNLYKKK